MAHKETWTVGDMHAELKEAVDSWVTKVPVLNKNKETLQAKEMYKTIAGLIEVVGKNATSESLSDLTRVEKLKAALAGETTVGGINRIVEQFQGMDLTQRIVRGRHLAGKPLPQSYEALQTIMKVEGHKYMSKALKSRMVKQQQERMLRKLGGKRLRK